MASSKGVKTMDEQIQPYSIHVSSRYLELTRRKLELTRMPRDAILPAETSWCQGTPKATVEPLVDFWLEKYNWRDEEALLNQKLPQFRTVIETSTGSRDNDNINTEALRIHFVHKRSNVLEAIPLLFCHGWPGSFIEVLKIIEPLTSPIPTDFSLAQDTPGFHVVVPSNPGFGFSDASMSDGFGAKATAEAFDGLMKKLGYNKYVAHGSGWAFKIIRMLAMNHAESCLAVHTVSPSSIIPSLSMNKMAYIKFHLSRLTGARIPWLNFGYLPSDFQAIQNSRDPQMGLPANSKNQTPSKTTLLSINPLTMAYALCDSPSGLLAVLLDTLHRTSKSHLWQPSDLINWVKLIWLPGPEGGLRWLHATEREDCFARWSNVPLGISSYQADVHNIQPSGLPIWLESVQRLVWIKRSPGSAGLPGWDVPDDLIIDLREFCAAGRKQGWLSFR